jgi:chemotaxis protein methyltransferase CheR
MEPEVYVQIKSSVKKILDIDLNHYKDEQMKRRLDSWLVRSHKETWNDYLQWVSANPEERSRFRDYLTINVTEFFRDMERWNTLRKEVIPALLNSPESKATGRKGLRLWSAGCSIGVEAYTLAILLDEEAPHLSHYLLASDLDRSALQKAKNRGPYSTDEIRNLTAEQRQKYLEPGNTIKPALAQRITFKEQDLFGGEFEQGFDLIVCRNVVIYFTAEAKTVLYAKFHRALRPGGILFLGGTEIIPHPTEIGFKNHGISFYLKA